MNRSLLKCGKYISLGVAFVLISGCSRKTQSSNDNAPSQNLLTDSSTNNVETPNSSQSYATPPAAAPSTETGANLDLVLKQLTRSLRSYVLINKTMPRSFEEFARATALQVPPVPTGKKFEIDSHSVEVIAVNR
jgi:hypothetical protein